MKEENSNLHNLNKKALFNGLGTKNKYIRKFKPYFNGRTNMFTKKTLMKILNKYDPYFLLAEISRQNSLLRNKSKYSRKKFFITN